MALRVEAQNPALVVEHMTDWVCKGGKKFASDDGALNQPASEASVEMGFLQAGELRQRGVKMPTHNEIEEERRNEGQRTAGHEEGIADSQICAA